MENKKEALLNVFLKRKINNGIKFVIAYHDKECKSIKAIFNSSTCSLPNKKRQVLIINDSPYNPIWL